MHDTLRWDIFCAVIDNFGDAGVCWRLARQLAAEQGAQVRLLIDDPASLALLVPAIDPECPHQVCNGVVVEHWTPESPPLEVAEVVIEAFGAPVPAAYLAAMAGRQPAPVWINLEYLSAEKWIEGCHCLPSPHPRLPLTQWFFYPGFTAASGGLLREARLIAERDVFRSRPGAFANFLQRYSIAPPVADALKVSLFAYQNSALSGLLDAWAQGPGLIWCGVPRGLIHQSVAVWLGQELVEPVQRGALTIVPLPFFPQGDYDRLLWGCDLNFVRGEDSFVRALWAAVPIVWHIYPQQEDVHRVKLGAFLDGYREGLDESVAAHFVAFHDAWNCDDAEAVSRLWPGLLAAMSKLSAHARRFADTLARQDDLVAQLALFVKSKLE